MREFGPKAANHPSVGELCPVCSAAFKEGDYTTLISLGPDPNNAEDVHKALVGQPYNARAVEIHVDCRLVLAETFR